MHVSNFFTSVPQVELAERLLSLAGAPDGSAVFFCNSGAEALEAAIKLARRTGRTGIVAAEGAFHGRTTGRPGAHPQARLPRAVRAAHPRRDARAVGRRRRPARRRDRRRPSASCSSRSRARPACARATPATCARPASSPARPARCSCSTRCRPASAAPARGSPSTQAGVVPDAITLAKGLGGGVPIGALMTFGPEVSTLLAPGMHGSTFGGNPLACAAGLAVLDTIAGEGLLDHARAAGEHLERRIGALDHPLVTGIRGAGLLRAITLAGDHAAAVAAARPRRRLHRQPRRARRHPPRPAAHRHHRRARPVRRRPARAARRRHRRCHPRGRPMTLRHFLADDDLTAAEQRAVLDRALALKAEPLRRPLPRGPAHGRRSSSTSRPCAPRCRSSAPSPGSAASRWSSTAASPAWACASRSADVARVLGPQSAAVVWRTFAQSGLEEMAAHAGVPVVNALTDDYHPCQVLADLLTIRRGPGSTAGLTLAYVGDGANNMAHSYLLGGALAGMHVRVGTPASHPPQDGVVARAPADRRGGGRVGDRHRRRRRGGRRRRRRRHRHLGVDGPGVRGGGTQGGRQPRSRRSASPRR